MMDWLKKLFSSPSIDTDSGVDLDGLSEIIGCPIEKPELFEQALQHRSLLRGQPNAHMQSNERLEYLGDAVLGFLVAEHLYETYTDQDEGFLTRLRAKLVNGRALAARARDINLGSYVRVSDSLSEDQRNSNSILADAFEAVIGAIYLDQGIESTRTFVRSTVLSHMDLDQLANVRDNYKSILLEYVQARRHVQPEYVVISESGPSHDKRFVVAVTIGGEEFGRGEDRSKKGAEQIAAQVAIEKLLAQDESEGQSSD